MGKFVKSDSDGFYCRQKWPLPILVMEQYCQLLREIMSLEVPTLQDPWRPMEISMEISMGVPKSSIVSWMDPMEIMRS